MNVDNPRNASNGWTHQASRRAVSPNRRRTKDTGTVDTAMKLLLRWRGSAYHTGRGCGFQAMAEQPPLRFADDVESRVAGGLRHRQSATDRPGRWTYTACLYR